MHSQILVVTGPTDSGKSTLARILADRLKAPLITDDPDDCLKERLTSETAQDPLQEEVLAVARRLHQRERQALRSGPQTLICDTDLLMMIVLSEEIFGECDHWILEAFEAQLNRSERHYLLCDWQIPWQGDPLRKNLRDRPALFEHFVRKLEQYGAPFTVVKGPPDHRLRQALDLVEGRW